MLTIRVYDFDETLVWYPSAVYRVIFGAYDGSGGWVAFGPKAAERAQAHIKLFAESTGRKIVRRGGRRTLAFEYDFEGYRRLRGSLGESARWLFPTSSRDVGDPEALPAFEDMKAARARGDQVFVVSSRARHHKRRVLAALELLGVELSARRVYCTGSPEKGRAAHRIVRLLSQKILQARGGRLVFHDDNPVSLLSVRRAMAAIGIPCEAVRWSRQRTGEIESIQEDRV